MRPAVRALLLVVVVAGVAAGAYHLGRASADTAAARVTPASYTDGYRAGREAAFGGFDGGWSYGEPYVVTLRRGGPGITYRFARRWPMLPRRTYHVCGRWICSR